MTRFRYYPPNLSDAGLSELRRYAFHTWDNAPEFNDWLSSVVCDEHARRITSRFGRVVEVKIAELPTWTDSEVADALTVSEVLCHCLRDASANLFMDDVLSWLTTTAAVKLKRKDDANCAG